MWKSETCEQRSLTRFFALLGMMSSPLRRNTSKSNVRLSVKVGDLVKPCRADIWGMPSEGIGIITNKRAYIGQRKSLYQVYWTDFHEENKKTWIHEDDLAEVVSESR